MSLYNKKFFKDKKNHKRTNSFKDFYNNIIFNENFNNSKNNKNIFKDNKKFNINFFFNNNNNKNNINLNRPFTQNLNDKFNVKKNFFNNNNKDIINNNFYNTLFHFPTSNKSFFENKKIEDDYLKLTNNFENNIINKKETKNILDLNNIISNNVENNNNNINNNNNVENNNNSINNINNIENDNKNNNKNNNNNINNNNNNNNNIKNNININNNIYNNNYNINNNNNYNINNNNNIINNNNNNYNINNNNKNLNKNNFLKNNLFRPYKSKIPIAQNFNTYLYKTNLSYRNYINSNNKIYSSYLTKQNIKNNLNNIFNYKNNNSTLTPNISSINNIDFNNNNNKTLEPKSILSYNNKLSKISSQKSIKNINFKINYSSLSKAGCSISGVPKTNQDNFYTQSSKITNSYIEYTFGVFDGHGVEGHLVSQTVKSFFETQPFTNLNSKENLKSTFNSLSNSINNTKNINTFISGSTCVLVHVSNRKILCANVGDSRAIVMYKSNDDLLIKNLSFDHKPENFEEKKRIEKLGGRVERIFDFGPFRVWFKTENFPGLAMSRSFGDKAAHSVGVIDEPDIIEMDVFSDFGRAACIVVASDGVWEFVGNEHLKEIVAKYLTSKNAKDCVRDIVDMSRRLWERSGFAVDDITCVVGFFDYDEDVNVNVNCNNNNFKINEEKNI